MHSLTIEDTKSEGNDKYLDHGSKTCQMVVSMENNSPESIETQAKQIVDKFNNQNCSSSSKDRVDTVTPVQTPVHESMELEFPEVQKVENVNQGNAPDLSAKPVEYTDSKDSGIEFVARTNTNDNGEKENSYPLKNPGLCLYIGLLHFDVDSQEVEVSLENRHSSSNEFKKMRDSFERLGCFVKKKPNPTAQEAKQFLQEGINWCEKLNPSYVVLIISTHGQEVSDPMKDNKSESTEQHPSGINIQKKQSRTERVHQLFFNDGRSLLTRDIVRMFDHNSCPALKDKPCLFFIQSCRSRFGLDGHENFDPGVMVNVLTAEEEIKAGLKHPDSVEASGDTSHKDTTDVKRSIRKQTEEETQTRLMQIQEWEKRAKLAVLHRHILDYKKYIREHPPISPHEEEGREETATKLFETLLKEGFTFDQVTEIKQECHGCEQEILDFFFPEPIISDPPPCVNDALVMFASAPGKEAYNRDKQGGWLITNLEAQLKETLKTKPEKIDLLAELTKVSRRIAYKYETDTDAIKSSGHKSVPCLYHRLSRDIIIWPEEIRRAKELLESDQSGEYEKFFQW
ncbi:uncharacterized protein LOC134283514 [Saccostrea cucullata]|uniref:uncharacterized protein LOC134283514 n=1 Tax=Saccostrea cuccullata TaxID=36930 RepID=UPI002ED2FAF5